MEHVAQPRLEARDVSMRFGGVVALEHASLSARAGEVTCLLGDNGAGKSTLIKVLAGVHPPTGGACLLDGETVRFRSPREALSRGIATVYQDLAMVPLMSVWRNFFLGSEPTSDRGPFRRIDADRCREETRAELAAMGIELRDPEQPVGSLSGGERQAVAIARALHFGARVLILDEPTAALGLRQSERVLDPRPHGGRPRRRRGVRHAYAALRSPRWGPLRRAAQRTGRRGRAAGGDARRAAGGIDGRRRDPGLTRVRTAASSP